MKVNQFDPYLGEDEILQVSKVIRANWITEGEQTEQFQDMLKSYCHVKHAILLPNGTLALYVAMMILGIGPGDEVIVPDFTFIGSATAVLLTGAKPVFVDVNLNDFNINIKNLEDSITSKTKAIMPVHIYGQAADMAGVMRVAKQHNLKVVEDAAQGMGVTFGSQHAGAIGDVGCLSFYADKTITMGEGGALLTQNDELADKCLYFKNQGRLKRGSFIHPHLGFNFRVTDLQAAIGVAQMKQLALFMDRKSEIERLYKRNLKEVGEVRFPFVTNAGSRVPFRINILVQDPEALQKYLTEKDIGIRRFFYPLHRQPCFDGSDAVKQLSYPHSEELFARGLSLPSGVGLKDEQIKYVCSNIKQFYTSVLCRS